MWSALSRPLFMPLACPFTSDFIFTQHFQVVTQPFYCSSTQQCYFIPQLFIVRSWCFLETALSGMIPFNSSPSALRTPLTSWWNLTGHHLASPSQPQPGSWRKEIKQIILPSPSPSLSPQAIVIRLKGIAKALEDSRPVKNASVLTVNYHKSHKTELLKMSYVVPCASNHPRVLVKNADYWAQLQTNCLSLSSLRNRPWDKDSIAESWFGEVVPGNTSKGRRPIKGVLSCQLLLWVTGVSSHWELWKQHSTLVSASCQWRREGVEVFGHQLSS